VREQFTPEQWSALTAVRRFVDTEVIPVAGDYWERAELRDITGIGAFA
jgi:glutaryl-CoA dehydrogenase